eukprot:510786_1
MKFEPVYYKKMNTLQRANKLALDKVRPNMEQNTPIEKGYHNELNYHDTYITELNNVFMDTNNIAKYQDTIESNIQFKTNENEINILKLELDNKNSEVNKLLIDDHLGVVGKNIKSKY